MFTNSVVNPAHELRVREIFLEEYPAHLLGAIPMLLSHQVAGRKGEYARGTSTIMDRSEEHTSELQSLMRISYAVFCLKKKIHTKTTIITQKSNTSNITDKQTPLH